MPLPPAPTKMGDQLSTEQIRAVAPVKPTRTRKAATKSEQPLTAKPVRTTRKSVGKVTAATSLPQEKTENTQRVAKPAAKTAVKSPAKAKKATSAAPIAEALEATTPTASSSRERLGRPASGDVRPRLFVLDTNVLLHDPMCLFRFEEHDVFLPIMTLEELDNHKTGTSDLARNARQVSRFLDQLIEHTDGAIEKGLPLNSLGNREATGRLYFEMHADGARIDGLPEGKADNIILSTVAALVKSHANHSVVLVSKDINMRIKAFALGLAAEDYFNDKTLDDTDLIFSGKRVLAPDFWEASARTLKSWQTAERTCYQFNAPFAPELALNEFLITPDGMILQVKKVEGKTVTAVTLTDFIHGKANLWGIHAKNPEQSMAMNILTDPEIDFVTLLGPAGTGKTLMTLAAAISQVLDERRYTEVIFTRATVSLGEEIGYLPGTEEEKMTPWMGALDDNLEVLNKTGQSGSDWSRKAANDLITSRIRVKSMSFMRGRTFLNKFVIIDEAQNLSPKQMKALITRAGPGTKIVCMGNIAQIDTPYLSEGSSGLTYVVDRFRNWAHAGHITLERGERSRLADFANEAL